MAASIGGGRLSAVRMSPSEVNSRTWKAWWTPCHPMTSSSKKATTFAFGCSDRFRPSCPDTDRSPDLASSAGVWSAPPATTTTGARTVSRWPPGRTRCPVTPVTARPSRVIRSTRQSANSRPPSARARGTLVTSIDRFAPVGQPLTQLFVPAQCSWLRRFGTTAQPLASAPAFSSSESRPIVSGSCWPTECRVSARAKKGSISCSPTASTPSSDQRCSTRLGVRQDIPPLTTVDPPTHRPSANSTDGRPIVIPPPPSRYSVRSARTLSALNDSVGWYPPSSIITTSRPASASSAAIVAPPAPDPTITTSHSALTSPVTSAPVVSPAGPLTPPPEGDFHDRGSFWANSAHFDP
jgi:hypothetical protein